MVVDPSYFVVQPLEYLQKLHEMTEEMNIYHLIEKLAVENDTICVANSFAIQDEGKKWCRDEVMSVVFFKLS